MTKILYTGAEAIITLISNKIKKERITKSYRNPVLDNELRTQRTSRESKSLAYASRLGLNTPSVLSQTKTSLLLENIEAEKLQSFLSPINYKPICSLLGKEISKMHKGGLIHGDLTTSNLLYKDSKLFFIDFGLSFHSSRLEDRAVDLLNLKKTFESTHPELKEGFSLILSAYADKDVEKQIEKIEKRARYL